MMYHYFVQTGATDEDIDADSVEVVDGCLIFKIRKDVIVVFAPGKWTYAVATDTLIPVPLEDGVASA